MAYFHCTDYLKWNTKFVDEILTTGYEMYLKNELSSITTIITCNNMVIKQIEKVNLIIAKKVFCFY
jgi:hypothetical protein